MDMHARVSVAMGDEYTYRRSQAEKTPAGLLCLFSRDPGEGQAKAGTHLSTGRDADRWILAFAGIESYRERRQPKATVTTS
jgi:hypothetical protein